MQLKIYFDEKPVYLCDELSEELKEILHHPDAVFIDEFSTPAINSLLHEIKKEDFHAGVILSDDLEKLRKSFFKHFTTIEAAGGIVQNDKKELLFIYRLDKWDLPKGKVEENEEIEVAAAREIEEETGLKDIILKKKIGETYHTYNAYGKHYLKTTHWFYFTSDSHQKLQPQLEENITLIKWIKTKDIKTPMETTYASIKDIMHCFFDAP
ncbi:NUDIX hydrolase [Ferruginibacter sp. HRS2-29]|uniref:NUDIX hydrolase n=1 Tax=Ferruginibacter sp. HRS2-29 TaxID=2487334 RepID=UPI0020CEEA88|nr:NUDIX domain-containing protein [Ferruginibacter sp. HRS2-29]MCP9753403.1 NUDIX domain-containing protein [Ferruginibacter sp. HRS2-29]